MNSTPARDSIPELVDADAAVNAHADVMPQMPLDFFTGTATARVVWLRDVSRPWEEKGDQLTAHRDAVYQAHSHKLCSKCRGTGRTQWLLRSGSVCYTCNGSGWKAKAKYRSC